MKDETGKPGAQFFFTLPIGCEGTTKNTEEGTGFKEILFRASWVKSSVNSHHIEWVVVGDWVSNFQQGKIKCSSFIFQH